MKTRREILKHPHQMTASIEHENKFQDTLFYEQEDVDKEIAKAKFWEENHRLVCIGKQELEFKHKRDLLQLQKELLNIHLYGHKKMEDSLYKLIKDKFAEYLYSPNGLRRIDDESEAIDTPLMLGTKSKLQSNAKEHIHLFDKDTMICSKCGKKPSNIMNNISQSNPKDKVLSTNSMGNDTVSTPDKVSYISPDSTSSRSGGDTLTITKLESMSYDELNNFSLSIPKEDEFIHYVIDDILLTKIKNKKFK